MGSGEQLKYVTPITEKVRNYANELNSRYQEIENEIDKDRNQISQLINPNLLDNGGFSIWQRGDVFVPTSNIYTADRWFAVDSQPGKVERVYNTCPESLSKYACKVTVAANKYNILAQPLLNIDELNGKIFTLSFWVKGSKNIDYVMDFGGDLGAYKFEITTQWKKIVATKKMTSGPVTRQKGIGFFSMLNEIGGNTIELSDIKLEYGKVATPFVPENETLELLKCQRYYVGWNGLTYSAQTTFGYRAGIKYPTKMRINPTLITEIFGGGTAAVVEGVTQDGFTFGSNGNQILTKYYADAEIY